MSTLNCSACAELQENAAEFVVNGVNDTVCTSLKNNSGFSPSSGHDDETDLDLANDCLVGNLTQEIDAYDVCDWKDYIKKLVPNLWNMLKALICTIGGLWTKVECIADNLDTTSTPRMWVEKEDIVYSSGFNINANSTGVAVSYCNTHCYTLFTLTESMKNTLNASEVYSGNGYLVFKATGTWTSPYYIVRQEEQVGITSGGFFTFMASHTNNGDGTHTISVYLRSRLRDLSSFSADGIIVNMPTNIKLLGATAC